MRVKGGIKTFCLLGLNNTIDQMDLREICRTFHPVAAEYTFFSIASGTFYRIGHIIGHKTTLSKLKIVEIIPKIFILGNKTRNQQQELWKIHEYMENKQYTTE